MTSSREFRGQPFGPCSGWTQPFAPDPIPGRHTPVDADVDVAEVPRLARVGVRAEHSGGEGILRDHGTA